MNYENEEDKEGNKQMYEGKMKRKMMAKEKMLSQEV